MRICAEGFAATAGFGFPVEIWNVAWAIEDFSGQARRNAFLTQFAVEIVTIGSPESDPPVTMVRPSDLGFWAGVALFILTTAAACGDGCLQSTRPTP